MLNYIKQKYQDYQINKAFKILDKYNYRYYTVNITPLQLDVDKLVLQMETRFASESGEWKRSQVMTAVMGLHPDVSESDIAFAIELAVRHV